MASRVLFVNHTSSASGAEYFLIDVLKAMPRSEVAGVLAPPGELDVLIRESGYDPLPLIGLTLSFRFSPWHAAVSAVTSWKDAIAIKRSARRLGATVIHANSVRAALLCGLARVLGAPPVIVYVHDILPHGFIANTIKLVIRLSCKVVVANSSYCLQAFGARGASGVVIYNPLDAKRFRPPTAREKRDARRLVGLAADCRIVGVVGQITPWKGQLEAIEAIALLRNQHPNLHLLVVGSPKFSNFNPRYNLRNYEASLVSAVSQHQLDGRVHFIPDTADVLQIYFALDLLMVPSWEEPFGRVVAEGMAVGLPVVATNIGGPAELIRDGIDGVLLPPQNPRVWSEGIDALLTEPSRRAGLGLAARKRVQALLSNATTIEALRFQYSQTVSRPT